MEPWYKNGLQFGCKVCGRCCGGEEGFVWVTTEEINRMAKTLGIDAVSFEQSFVKVVRGRKRSLKEYPNGDCVLLDEKTHGCRVYEDRPIQCRTWPFWSQNIDTPNSWKVTSKFCPGCNQGRLYTLEEIEELRAGIEL